MKNENMKKASDDESRRLNNWIRDNDEEIELRKWMMSSKDETLECDKCRWFDYRGLLLTGMKYKDHYEITESGYGDVGSYTYYIGRKGYEESSDKIDSSSDDYIIELLNAEVEYQLENNDDDDWDDDDDDDDDDDEED